MYFTSEIGFVLEFPGKSYHINTTTCISVIALHTGSPVYIDLDIYWNINSNGDRIYGIDVPCRYCRNRDILGF